MNDDKINSWPSVLGNVYLCTLPALVIIFLPVLVGSLVQELQFSNRQSGFIVTLDMLGYTLGTVAAFFGIKRFNWRSFALGAVLLMVLANALSGGTSDYSQLLALRFFSGLGGGLLTAITFAAIGQMRSPDSVYGLWLVSQAAFGLVGFQFFYQITANWGGTGGFMVLSLLLLLGVVAIRVVPPQHLHKHEQSKDRPESAYSMPTQAVMGILAILLVYIGLMVIYTFLERIGTDAGLSSEEIAKSFSMMSVAGLIGGGIAAKLGSKYGRKVPIVISTAGCVLAINVVVTDVDFLLYAAVCCLYFGLWSCLLPYLVGVLAAADDSGQLLSLGNAAIGGGLALGPFVAALLVQDNNFTLLSLVSSLFIVLGIACIFPLLNCLKVAESQAFS